MAFNFSGTLTLDQLNELRNFLTSELTNVENQINTLRVQKDNLNRTRMALLKVDETFGGSAVKSIHETELTVLKKISEQDDVTSANLIEKTKKPFLSSIKFKRERLEYKILKLTDAIEQTKEAIDRKAIAKNQTNNLLNRVEALFNQRNQNYLFSSEKEKENFERGITS